VSEVTAKDLHLMPLFEGFSPEVLEPLARQMALRSHAVNQAIVLQNDWGSTVYFILEGWVKIRTHDTGGAGDYPHHSRPRRDLWRDGRFG
jgi:CRP-like cAMP-binding protein